MKVLEYLKIINNVPTDEALTSRNLYRIGGGFLDFVPNINDFEHAFSLSAPRFFVGDNSVIVKLVVTLKENDEYVDKTVEREIQLNDDIALHCRKGETPATVIERSIAGLLSVHNSELRMGAVTGEKPSPINSRIDILKRALEEYKKLEGPAKEDNNQTFNM